jgi:hypothetical protein
MVRPPVYKNGLFEHSIEHSVGIRWTLPLRASLYNMYEFGYFNCKYVRIKSKITGLAEVESASFFSPLIANPLIFPYRISPLIRKFFS